MKNLQSTWHAFDRAAREHGCDAATIAIARRAYLVGVSLVVCAIGGATKGNDPTQARLRFNRIVDDLRWATKQEPDVVRDGSDEFFATLKGDDAT